MATIFDVAQRIHQLNPELTKLELAKLCFFAQGWHTAWTGRALFNEPMEAWMYGPVSPALRQTEVCQNNQVISITAGDADNLSDYEREVIDHTVPFYQGARPFGTGGLSEQSHGFAWNAARGDLAPDAKCTNAISIADIRREFTEKMWANEPAPQAPTGLPAVTDEALAEALRRAELAHREALRGLARM